MNIQQLASVRIRILWDQIPVFVEIKIMLALTASSKDNPSKPVPECQTVLDYAAATEMMEAAMVTARTLKMFKKSSGNHISFHVPFLLLTAPKQNFTNII